ncbi:MAG: GNAT family N-acetyltransferase [Clostridia bacterium]|nr:GNAT family N-acetyltransferase [Clostridia bacterium]
MISLYRPQLQDLWFRQSLLEDEETMSYNHAWGGAIPFPAEKWADWYEWWMGDPNRYYRYVVNETGEWVGEIAYHYDEDLGGYVANVIVHARYRGRGYGGQALDALCRKALENGIDVLYDDIARDNKAKGMFERRGFVEVGRTEDKIILKKIL